MSELAYYLSMAWGFMVTCWIFCATVRINKLQAQIDLIIKKVWE